jgi:hypothetical protein
MTVLIDTEDLKVGTRFDTEFESYCVVTDPPDELGNFLAIDSEGVECQYGIEMVEHIHRSGPRGRF